MKPITSNRLLGVLLALLLASGLGHRLGHAQAGRDRLADAIVPPAAPASTGRNQPNPVTPSVVAANDSEAWSPSASAMATALGDVGVVPAYQAIDLDWLDSKRERKVPVRLYLPDGASANTPVPLVVFSHGLGGSRLGYSYLGRYFAQHGVASLHLQHIGSDRALWTGNVFGLSGRLKAATTEQEALARAQDFSFALDTLLGDPGLRQKIDATKIVAAGHSYGANTTLLVAGARINRDGLPGSLRDVRVKGALVMSAPPFYGVTNGIEALASMPVPSLHITATEDVIRVPGYYSGADERIGMYDAYQGAAKSLVVFKEGSHSIFTDRLNSGGAELNPQVKRATREIALAFVAQVLGGTPASGATTWAERNAAIVMRYEPMQRQTLKTAEASAIKP
jgi:predicted dienelactone hydrolase